jgi:hypothetical protein
MKADPCAQSQLAMRSLPLTLPTTYPWHDYGTGNRLLVSPRHQQSSSSCESGSSPKRIWPESSGSLVYRMLCWWCHRCASFCCFVFAPLDFLTSAISLLFHCHLYVAAVLFASSSSVSLPFKGTKYAQTSVGSFADSHPAQLALLPCRIVMFSLGL